MEDQFAGSCWKCANEGIEMDPSPVEYCKNADDVYLSTTPFVPGHTVVESLGIVSGEAIIGTNIFSDMLAGMADIVGGRAGSYENKLRYTRQVAMTQMALEGKAGGANAVVGVSLSYETIRGTMLMVAACGTAVVVVPKD